MRVRQPPPSEAARLRWGDLRKRVISAAILGPAALACVWFGADAWTALMALGAAGLACEWAILCRARPSAWPGVAAPALVLAAGAAAVAGHEALAVGAAALGAVLAWLASGKRSLGAGVLYVGIPCIALIWLRGDDAAGRANVLFLVLVVWASDIGAYAAGRTLGGPKLAPAISPGKTWTGASGGLVSAMVVGEAAAQVLSAGTPPARAAVLAAGLGIAAQAGDLLESWAKRQFGVKDSSQLIPGHGGLLDRLDGILAAAPVAALIALFVGPGRYLWR